MTLVMMQTRKWFYNSVDCLEYSTLFRLTQSDYDIALGGRERERLRKLRKQGNKERHPPAGRENSFSIHSAVLSAQFCVC